MIELFGPNYRYNGEILTKPEVIWINDHHYDEEQKCFHVKKLLENSACDPSQHVLIFDHVNHEDDLIGYQTVHFPIFLASEAEEFCRRNIQTDWTKKTHAFNFMINKPRLHREFLLMLIEHFQLQNYKHTLAWKSIATRNHTLKQLTNNALYLDIIDSAPVSIPTTDYKFGPETCMEQGVLNGNFANAETYKHLLQKNVFEPTCVSLITEPVFYEKEALVSEKTIMSIFAGTLPIWVGGWRCADSMKYLGFDVFDDIIDHSYQNMPDPMDRCYFAIQRNLDVLTNFDTTHQFLQQNQHRLQHNLDLVLSNVFLQECFEQIKKNPKIKTELMRILPNYRHNMFEDRVHMVDDDACTYEVFGRTQYGKKYIKPF